MLEHRHMMKNTFSLIAIAVAGALATAPAHAGWEQFDGGVRGVKVADLALGQVATTKAQACRAATSAPLTRSRRFGDLNGDGRDDVLMRRDDGPLRHSAGKWHYYAMYGHDTIGGSGAAALTEDLDWRFQGLGDLNGDGRDDVLLRHGVTGRWRYAAMDGRTPLDPQTGKADLTDNRDWGVAGIADLDGDGNDDVLLRHSETGNWFFYPMHGRVHLREGRGMVDLPADPQWRVSALGDLDGNSKAEVLLRHATSGHWRWYPMDGRERGAGAGALALPTGASWMLTGVADLDGDGKDDILLRHRDGRWHWYPMDGRTVREGGGPTDLTTRTSWRLAGLGDLNGDGRDDVLLRHHDGRWNYRAMDGGKSIPAHSGVVHIPVKTNFRLAVDADPAPADCLAKTAACDGTTAPGAPTIDWMEDDYAIVGVSSSATAYEELATVKPFAEVPVRWSKYSGANGNQVRYLLDGALVLEASLAASDNANQNGSATLQVSKGGRYDLEVALCDDGCCTTSAAKKIVVADTDGSHADPITLTAGENNRPYTNTTDSVVGAYFVEWGVYGRAFPVDKVPAYNLTHILYGFIPICGGDEYNDSLKAIQGSFAALQRACKGRQDFKVAIHDPWAALQRPQAGHDHSTPYKGNFGQLMELKRAYPDIQVLPSIGGWTLSDPFYFFHDVTRRNRFVQSVEEFLATWKFFDGVDVDWEFPGGFGANPRLGDAAVDRRTYALLMEELRRMLDRRELATGREMTLSSAISAGTDKIARVDYGETQQYLDHIFVMSYDFYGAWSNEVLGHQTALYAPKWNPADKYNTHIGVQALLAQGVSPDKLVLGVAMYGRGWTGVSGWTGGDHLTGTATGPVKGTWEDGVLDYRALAELAGASGWTRYYDTTAQAPYLFKSGSGDLVTYDDRQSVKAKGAYVRTNKLGGLFAWEIDADNGDILNAMHEGLGHGRGTANRRPVADAGFDRTVESGAEVALDASKSYDLDGDTLTYRWSRKSGPSVTLDAATSAKPAFTAPSVRMDREIVFEVTVSDGKLSSKARVALTVRREGANLTPQADAGPDRTVQTPATVTLDGSASSDRDGDALTYRWSQVSGPVMSVANASGAVASFKALVEERSEVLTFELEVSDGTNEDQDQVRITLLPAPTNAAPVVSLRGTVSVVEGESLSITASATDEDGDALIWSWDTGNVSASGTDTATITFTAPQVDTDTEVTMTVTVSDGTLEDSTSVVVTMTDATSTGCRTSDPNAPNYPVWDSTRGHYVAGDRVSHSSLVWEAKYWTQEEPAVGATDWPSDWTLVSTGVDIAWNPERVYLKDDEANHGERRYRANWWTQGNNPATDSSGVWTDIGATTCASG